MLKIARFKMKENAEIDLKDASIHASFVDMNADLCVGRHLFGSIYLYIGFPKNLLKWNDFDFVLVLDDDFGQPFTPFYCYLDNRLIAPPSPFLVKIIEAYNDTMRSFPFLEEIKEDK